MKNEIDVVAGMKLATMTLHLKRYRELRLRMWIATKLFRLGAWILNVNLTIDYHAA